MGNYNATKDSEEDKMILEELLKKFEGEKLKPYLDTRGYWTIGVGFNYSDNPLPEDIQDYLYAHGEITQEMSDRLLNISINEAVGNLQSIFGHWIMIPFDEYGEVVSEDRFNALVSIMFNLGINKFKEFKKMIKAIKESDWNKAADELLDSDRTKQVGKRAEIEVQMLREG